MAWAPNYLRQPTPKPLIRDELPDSNATAFFGDEGAAFALTASLLQGNGSRGGGFLPPEEEHLRWRRILTGLCCLAVLSEGRGAAKAQNQVMGELEFEGKSKLEQDAGVWIDGGYVGYLKELNGKKKIVLLPGQHEVVVRQSGYLDNVQKVVVQPGEKRLVSV